MLRVRSLLSGFLANRGNNSRGRAAPRPAPMETVRGPETGLWEAKDEVATTPKPCLLASR
jgi:hypothetical protein